MSILGTSKNFCFMYLPQLALLSHSQENHSKTTLSDHEERKHYGLSVPMLLN
jgi:hypothetical protein